MKKNIYGVLGVSLALTGCMGGGAGPGFLSDNSSQAGRIANLIASEITCSALASPSANIAYADTSFFECQLSKSLQAKTSDVVGVTVAAEVSAALPSKGSEKELLKELPDRLSAWVYSAKEANNQVTVCIQNRPEFWNILIGLGLGAIEEFLKSRSNSPAARYKAVADYMSR